MVNIGRTILLLYAIAMGVGGIMGKMKGSTISLVAGLGCAGLLTLCYIKATTNPKAFLGGGTAIALLMAGQMFMRYQKTQHFMPAGLISVISVVAMIALGVVTLKLDR